MLALAITSPQSIGLEPSVDLAEEMVLQKRKIELSDVKDNFKDLKKQKISSNTDPVDQAQYDPNEGFVINGMSVTYIVVKYVAIKQCLSNDSPVDLALVCKEWSEIIRSEFAKDKDGWKAWYGVVGHEDEYKAFLSYVLQSRSHLLSTNWRVVEKIKEFSNPFKGIFHLPKDADFKGLDGLFCVMTGIPRALGDEYKGKTVVWFCPRFYMQKKFEKADVCQLKQILDQWSSAFPFGIFWTNDGTANVMMYLTNWDKELKARCSFADLIGKGQGMTIEHIENIGLIRWLVTCGIMIKFSLLSL